MHVMCYAPDAKSVLMFGGAGANEIFFGDLWSFSNDKWKKLSDSGPAPRVKFAFAYDVKRKVAVLFSGGGAEGTLNDTWEWNGHSWKKFEGKGPSGRVHGMMGFDPQSNRIILTGGFSDGKLNDTWAFDGKSWTELVNAGIVNDVPHGMFYDDNQRLNLVAGKVEQGETSMNNTWWILNKDVWEPSHQFVSTSSGSLQAISAAANNGIVVFDGDDIQNEVAMTMLYSNGKWDRKHLKGPSPRVGTSMVYDPTAGGVLLFGGSDRKNSFNDVWIFKEGRWLKL